VSVDRSELTARYTFELDQFQRRAFDALDAGRHVIVAAPTGSGKTVVAEYGIEGALAAGRRAFYTAPVKALSNQKYRDLIEAHGEDAVGLLTGDNAINPTAPIVVMTTEVLRNMIYAASQQLANVGLVVLDEVHFLQDAYRGPVWEEVIIHLPPGIRLVCLSATVSNVAELADWVSTVRGDTEAIVETRRPVELRNHYLVDDRTSGRLRFMPTFVDGHINRDALKLDESAARHERGAGRRGNDRRRGGVDRDARRRLATPSRIDTVGLLRERNILPAIYFIFSRAQCDQAASTCVESGLVLTSATERREIQNVIDVRLGGLDRDDLEVLGYQAFVRQLEAGVAAHHAGMVPPMKEVVEICFARGLVKVVFATETLAVGINMPARSVVIEKLTKFTGEHHERLTPGEYTQLTGRAGRRGIDDRGDAVVLWTPWVRFDDVARLASSTSFQLRSVFRPTYNMAANLIRRYDTERAHHLLNLSFAQYQGDRDVVRLESRLERLHRDLAELEIEAQSPFGDLDEYRRLRDADAAERREERETRTGAMRGAIARLRPGAVIEVSTGKHHGPVAVVATAHRKSGVRLTVVTKGAKSFHLHQDDFDRFPDPIGSVKIPQNFGPTQREFRERVARSLRKAEIGSAPRSDAHTSRSRAKLDDHPVARDPELRDRLGAASRADRIRRQIADADKRAKGKTHSLSNDFDRVVAVLDHYGYVDRDEWALTDAGELLARLFHESDLLVAEVVRDGVFDGLGAPDLAALVSCLVYEHRSSDAPPAPWFSSGDVRARWRRLSAISSELSARERSSGLPEHRPPDPTFGAVAFAWVAGEGFAEVVVDEELTGGDFVRTMKQLIDLLRQIAIVAPDRNTRLVASEAGAAAFRGVVADSSLAVPDLSAPTSNADVERRADG
jgi:ATP-dependent RNA helicase HelY